MHYSPQIKDIPIHSKEKGVLFQKLLKQVQFQAKQQGEG